MFDKEAAVRGPLAETEGPEWDPASSLRARGVDEDTIRKLIRRAKAKARRRLIASRRRVEPPGD